MICIIYKKNIYGKQRHPIHPGCRHPWALPGPSLDPFGPSLRPPWAFPGPSFGIPGGPGGSHWLAEVPGLLSQGRCGPSGGAVDGVTWEALARWLRRAYPGGPHLVSLGVAVPKANAVNTVVGEHIYIYILYIYIYIHVYIRTKRQKPLAVYTYIYGYIYIYAQTYVYVYMCMHRPVHTYIYIYIYKYIIYSYLVMHIYIYANIGSWMQK